MDKVLFEEQNHIKDDENSKDKAKMEESGVISFSAPADFSEGTALNNFIMQRCDLRTL